MLTARCRGRFFCYRQGVWGEFDQDLHGVVHSLGLDQELESSYEKHVKDVKDVQMGARLSTQSADLKSFSALELEQMGEECWQLPGGASHAHKHSGTLHTARCTLPSAYCPLQTVRCPLHMCLRHELPS